jgi:hypothetical protein
MARKKRDQSDWAEGKPKSRHSAGFGAFFSLNMLSLIGVALFAGIAVMGFVIQVDEAKESPVVGRIVAFGATGLSVALLAWAIFSYARLIKQVEVFDEGIVWGGERAEWGEIAAAYRAELRLNGEMVQRDLTIETDDGRVALFRMQLSKWDRLADRIQDEVFERKMPEAVERFEEGEELEFGELSLSQEGVTFKGELIPWKRVRKVSVENGWVCVKEKGREEPHQVRVSEVPNFPIFLRLTDLSRGRG